MSRSIRHLTPRYLKDRVSVALNQRRYPSNPWLTVDAVKLLDQIIKPTDIGVEFGSGRSTAWFAARLSRLISIESDPKWFSIVTAMIDKTKVDYRMQSDPDAYVAEADSFEEESIDLCLIDGIERDRCAEAMLPKLRAGGLFVIDNVNWFMPNKWTKSPSSLRSNYANDTWERIGGQLKDWRSIWTSNGVTDTAIWFKP